MGRVSLFWREIKPDWPVLAGHWIAGQDLNSNFIRKSNQQEFRRIYVQV
jgi:hypothetical protein